MTEKTLCIYHGNCADGFGSAWAVRHALGDDIDFHAGVHQNPPPDVTGRDVVLVDFSYKRDVVAEMRAKATSILILDHHKSAQEDLQNFIDIGQWTGKVNWRRHLENVAQDDMENAHGTVYVLFDMDRSGAGITWDFFHDAPRPKLIDHIEDRDLWKFELEGTREIQAAVFSHPYDFEVWDRLMVADLGELRREGEAIERKHHKDVAELVGVCKRSLRIGGHVVPAASLPYTLTSDAGHLMCRPIDEALHGVNVPPFAVCYWDTPEGRVFSLRSDDKWGAIDVSEIAKQYGGGGHKNAAGFRVTLEEARSFELETAQ